MADYTRQLVKQNGCEEVVTVLQARAEEVEIPEQVDVLVSEWMGNCLLVITLSKLILLKHVYSTISSLHTYSFSFISLLLLV